jgi:hypothetical protein
LSHARRTDVGIIDGPTFDAVLEKAKAEIEAHGGRCVLNISMVPDEETRYEFKLDARPDLPALLAADRQVMVKRGEPPTAPQDALAAELARLWTGYDAEDVVLCLISAGRALQVICRKKPWVSSAHAHCTCGFRVGVDAAHDEIHAHGAIVEVAMRAAEYDPVAVVRMTHTQNALDQTSGGPPPPPVTRLALTLAALMFGRADAAELLAKTFDGLDPELAADVAAIALPATALSADALAADRRDLPAHYPLCADLIEFTGEPGVVRYHDRALALGRPLFTADTPAPGCRADVVALGAPPGATMIDAMLHDIGRAPEQMADHGNPYFSALARARAAALIEVCTAGRPAALDARLQMARARVDAGGM